MNAFNLWKNVEKLSVDEFMCLLFDLTPGTVKFDYGNPELWPDGADIIYKLLSRDIWAEKLFVIIADPHRDPRNSEYFSETYGLSGNPWWADGDGKLYKRQLIKWLVENKISSRFFGTLQAPSEDAEKKDNSEPKEQVPTHDATSAVTIDTQVDPSESILSLPSVKKRISTEGEDNTQVRNTCRDNQEAAAYVKARKNQGAKPEEIAAELKEVGGGVAVIGCLLDPTRPNTTAAREYGKYLLKKAKQ